MKEKKLLAPICKKLPTLCRLLVTVVVLQPVQQVFAIDTVQGQSNSTAIQQPKLPSPLTLEYVLGMDVSTHPSLLQAQARSHLSQAQKLAAESKTGLISSFQGALRYIEPSEIAADPSQEDHSIHLFVKKRLYDFGRSDSAEDAAEYSVQSSHWSFIDVANRHRIAIVRRFFDVLLADLQFIRDNEAMSVAFVSLDRMRMRQELGQYSDIEVLEADTHYQYSRQQFFASRSLQRSTRNKLANIISRPGELASEVAEPKLDKLPDKFPEFELLQKQARENNPMLKSLRDQVMAAQKNLNSARASGRPFVDSEARISEYSRIGGNYNRWEVGLILNVPLWTGGATSAAIETQQAELLRRKALLRQAEWDIAQELLDTVLRLEELRAQQAEMASVIDFRDLYLDRSRALYDLEWKTDLGDSMVRVSDARYRLAKVRFEIAIARARLDALLGNEVFPLEEKQSEPKIR